MVRTFLVLTDLSDSPRVRRDLPLVHTGQRLQLRFHLERQHLGRHEVLEVAGDFRVMGQDLEATGDGPCQIVQVQSTGKAPSWQAVKKAKPKRLAPRITRILVE